MDSICCLLPWNTNRIKNANLTEKQNLLFIWTNSSVDVKCVNNGHVLRRQFKVKNLEILFNPGLGHRFWNGDVTTLHLISQHDLCWSFVVLLRQSDNFRVFQKQWVAWFSPGPVGRPQRAVRRYDYPFRSTEVNQLLLVQIGMALDLTHKKN